MDGILEKRYLTVEEAGKYLSVSKWTIYRWRDRGFLRFIPLPPGRPGKKAKQECRFDVQDLDDFMERRKKKAVWEMEVAV